MSSNSLSLLRDGPEIPDERASSSGQSLIIRVDNTEQGLPPRPCVKTLKIQEAAHNSDFFITSSSNPFSDKSLHPETSNPPEEKELETPVPRIVPMKSTSSFPFNPRKLIRSFLSFKNTLVPAIRCRNPTAFAVQALLDDNDNRAGASGAEIHARDKCSNASRTHGHGVPVRTAHRHAAHGDIVCAVPAQEDEGDEEEEVRECWQSSTTVEELGHSQSMQRDNRVKGGTYVERLKGYSPR